jgi:hypothetical protein
MSRLPYYIGAVAFTRSGWPDVGFYNAEILKRVGGPARKKLRLLLGSRSADVTGSIRK